MALPFYLKAAASYRFVADSRLTGHSFLSYIEATAKGRGFPKSKYLSIHQEVST